MNLDQLCCTPEQSRQFAELGLFEDSVFVWIGNTVVRRGLFGDGLRHMDNYRGPAPTVQELCHWLDAWELEDEGNRMELVRNILHKWCLDPRGMAFEILQIIKEQQGQQAQTRLTMGLARKLEEKKQ